MFNFNFIFLIIIVQIFVLQIQTVLCAVVPTTTSNVIENSAENYEIIREHMKIMQKAINPNINPCTDFSQYACGNYTKDMFGIGVYPNIASEEYLEIAFENSANLFEAAAKARNFYVSCKMKKTFKEQLEKISALRQEKLSWPIRENAEMWFRNSSAWMKLSENLKLMEVTSIIEFSKGEDGILEITYGKDFSSSTLDENEIYEMENAMRQLNINPEDIKNTVNEMLHYTKSRNLMYNSLSTYCTHCPKSESYNLRVDFRSLKEDFPKINWNRYLEVVFHRQFSDWEPVRVSHYLKTIPYLEFISNTNHRILTNYVLWKLIKELIKLDSGDNSCATKTFNKFDSVLPALYARVIFNDFNRQQYLEIFQRFKESFEQSKCRYDATNNDLESIFKTEIEYIRNLDKVFVAEKINDEFKNVQIYPDNYYQNLINLANHKSCTLHEKDCVKKVNLMVFIFEIASMYNKPLYYSFVDKYFSLWEKIIQTTINRGWNSLKYESAALCAKSQLLFLENKYGKRDSSSSSSDAVQSVIIETTLKQTYIDYKRWLMDNEDEQRERIINEYGNNLNSKKIFFINFAQAHCNQEEKYQTTVLQSLMNMDEFSKEFKCAPETPMNPSLKCRIF